MLKAIWAQKVFLVKSVNLSIFPAHIIKILIVAWVLFNWIGPLQVAYGQTDENGMKQQNGASADCRADDLSLTTDELMAKIYLAYGGRQALKKLEGQTMMSGKEKILFPLANVFAYRQWRKNVKVCVDLNNNAIPSGAGVLGSASFGQSTVFDGVSGWKVVDSQVVALSNQEVQILQSDLFLQPSVLAHWQNPGYEFTLLGRTTYKQVPVYSLSVKHSAIGKEIIFVDQRNYLVVAAALACVDTDTGGELNVVREFSEYHPVGNTLVACRQVEFLNEKPISEITLEKVELDSEIDDEVFNLSYVAPMVRLGKPVVVAFEYLAGVLWIKVQINGGEPLDFLLDTGASNTLIDRRIAAEHFLERQGNFNIAGASAPVSTQASIVPKLEIDKLMLKDVPVLIADLMPQSRQLGRRIAGIVGDNILSQFVVTIDYGKLQVEFRDSLTFSPQEGSLPVRLDRQNGPMIKGLLNGVDGQLFLVDTGAAVNHLPLAIAKRYVHGSTPKVTSASGLDSKAISLGTLVIDSLKFDGFQTRGVGFTYPLRDTSEEQGGFFQSSKVGVLGNPFWQNYVLTMDYRQGRVLLKENLLLKAQREIKELITAGDTKLIVQRDYRAADMSYQKALMLCRTSKNELDEARVLGCLGNLHRIIARDLKRPEQSPVAYGYFTKAQALAHKLQAKEVEGHILADWSLLYSDNGQSNEALATIQSALVYAPCDPQVIVDYAVHLYRARQYTDMQKYVEKALAIDPANWQALWYQVKLSEMYSDTPRLVETLKEILRFYPWSKLAKEKLTVIEGGTTKGTFSPMRSGGKH